MASSEDPKRPPRPAPTDRDATGPADAPHAGSASARGGVSRRFFLQSGAAGTAAFGWNARDVLAQDTTPDATPDAAADGVTPGDDAIGADSEAGITLTINGRARKVVVEPRTTLVETLRDTLGLTGTKIGCNHGQCGACTVLVDGQRVNSCLVLTLSVAGASVTTIEGLADPVGQMHPMQQAFAEHDAFQCGYCTPGQIMSAIACIDEGHAGSGDEIREYMSGNLCRCAAYPNIVAAIESVRDTKQG